MSQPPVSASFTNCHTAGHCLVTGFYRKLGYFSIVYKSLLWLSICCLANLQSPNWLWPNFILLCHVY